jgi:hypothetical protein
MISLNGRTWNGGQDALWESGAPPAMFPGETIYSLCARIGHNAPVPAAATSSFLLGHRYGPRHADLLHGLARLEAVYGGADGALVIDELTARCRTVLGGVMSFLTAADRHVLIQTIRRPHVPFCPKRMVEVRGALTGTATALRRCPDCAAADCKVFGVAYWHTVHQLPRVWACPWHARPLQWLPTASTKANTWLVAHRPCGDFRELHASAKQLELLHRLATGAVWCSCQWSLGPATLAIMVRSRLHASQLLRQEGFATEDEQRQIHAAVAEQLAQAGVPPFTVFRCPTWVGKTLSDKDFSHPLRWAALIASTLTESERLQPIPPSAADEHVSKVQMLRCGFLVSAPATLDQDYAAAQLRVSQMELFPERRGPRRRLAPAPLYDALSRGWRLARAAEFAGLTTPQVSTWVRKDKALASHWHESIARLRTEQARLRIEQHLHNEPCASRSEVMRAQVASVRALERYAPDLLERVLPDLHRKFAKQKTLGF